MKTLKFKPHLCELIREDKKTTTWRLFDDKNLQVGDELNLQDSDSGESIGRALIVGVVEKPMRDLNDDDWAGHEKFKNNEDMYTHYRGYYPDHEISPHTPIKIIKFKILK